MTCSKQQWPLEGAPVHVVMHVTVCAFLVTCFVYLIHFFSSTHFSFGLCNIQFVVLFHFCHFLLLNRKNVHFPFVLRWLQHQVCQFSTEQVPTLATFYLLLVFDFPAANGLPSMSCLQWAGCCSCEATFTFVKSNLNTGEFLMLGSNVSYFHVR